MKILTCLKLLSNATTATKVGLFLLLILAFKSSHAQSLSIIAYDSIVIGDATNSNAIFSHAAIKNNAGYDIDVHVKRIDGNYTALTDSNALCWGICYYPDVSESTMPITIEAGEIDSLNFTGHVYPDKDGIPASGDITYVFFDEDKPSDSIAMIVHYQVELTTSVFEETTSLAFQIYPNPASEYIHIEFDEQLKEPATFKLFTHSGKIIHQEKILVTSRLHEVSLSNFPGGMYVFSITNNSGLSKNGKFILKR